MCIAAPIRILNLYACLGGNRYKWDEVANIEVTAVEWDEELAKLYQENYEEITAKLKKLKALSERGEGGEKENAARMLTVMLKKYGLTLAELHSERVTARYFRFKNEYEEEVIAGCFFALGLQVYGVSKGGRTIKEVSTKCTAAQYADLRVMIDWHLKNAKEELKKTMLAYRVKHNLFKVVQKSDSKTLSIDEVMELQARVAAMNNKSFTNQRRIGEE